MLIVFNFLLFQLGWFATVLFAAAGHPQLSATSCLFVVGLHFLLIPAKWRKPDLCLLLLATLIGAMWESLVTRWGIVAYEGFSNAFAPYWIVLMWSQFAITLNHSLAWLKANLAIAALMGAVFGPMAFWGAAKLGALTLQPGITPLLILAAGWLVLLPLLLGYAGWLTAAFHNKESVTP